MIRRVIKTGIGGREALAKGAEQIAKAVGSTFGPFGQNFFLDKKNTITNDGVSVAREIQLPDEIENRGAAAIREAAIKTVDEAGDGTTTAIMLAHAIYEAASRLLPREGVLGKKPAAEISKQIERERKEVTDKLLSMATSVETEEQLINSAIVSTEDNDLGTLIGKAQWAVGKEGYLLAEETAERECSVEMVKGIRIDNGFGTSQIVNNLEKQTLEVIDSRVILTSISIKTMADWKRLSKVCEQLNKQGVDTLTIIARAWTDETISYCLQNINQGTMKIYPLNAPYLDMQERFKDMAAVTGAKFIDSEAARLDDIQISDVGFASKIVARRFDAIITGRDDQQTADRVAARVQEITEKHEGSQSDFEKKQLLERAAQLRNGFGIVKVGSPSDMERRRLFDKAEDAVNAVRAAFQEGTVAGGGLAFKVIAETLPDDYLLKRPLCVLYEQIMSSAPESFEIADWVRDPVKVLRVALEKACAAAAAFATAGGVVTQAFPKQLDEMLRVSNGGADAEV